MKDSKSTMSNLEAFQTQINQFIGSLVLTPLAQWLNQEKKVEVTVDELLDVLKLPKSSSAKPTTQVVHTASHVPVQTVLAPVSETPASGAKSRPKSKPPASENYTGATCKYVFKRGESKGKECSKPVASGSDFCEQCNNKKVTKTSDTKQTKLTETTTKPMVGFTTPVGKKVEKPKIELRETGQTNTYIDTQTNIVVKKVVDKDKTLFVAVGVQEESGFRTLTEDEKKEALSRNFSLQSDGKSEVKTEKKIVSKQPANNIPDIESDED